MRSLIIGLLMALLFSCGGGGGSDSSTAVIHRPGVYFGYFSTSDRQISETANHTNLMFNMRYHGTLDEQANQISRSGQPVIWNIEYQMFDESADGKHCTLRPDAATRLHDEFVILAMHNVLQNILGLYFMDEPDRCLSDAQVVEAVTVLRAIKSNYFELRSAKIVTVYGTQGFPGITAVDIVGHDRYGANPQQVVNELSKMIGPGQQIMLVPGGASPWNEDPGPWYNMAMSDSRVWGIVAFLYEYPRPDQGLGIRDNGMAQRYCEIGQLTIDVPHTC